MAQYIFDPLFETKFIQVCNQAESMNKAAVLLKMNYKTLCFHAKRLGCFKPNQAGKGLKKKPAKQAVLLESILNGTQQTFQTHKLKLRLIKEAAKLHQCESCKLTTWLGKPIPLELHHRDGNKYNNKLENLSLLCPNCHALTENYRAKNIRNLSAQMETSDVEPLKFGEALSEKTGNPEPSHTHV